MFDVVELRAVELYESGKALGACASLTGLHVGDVLHAVGKARREGRPPTRQCVGCPWRQGDHPCVWPVGVCGLGR